MKNPSDGEVRMCGKNSALAENSEVNTPYTPLSPGDQMSTIDKSQT